MNEISDSNNNSVDQPVSFDDESNRDFHLTEKNLKREFEKLNSDNKLTSTEIFKIIVDTRKFEIENFWKRATFFWGTLSILFAAYYGIKIESKFLAMLSLVGFVFSIVFSLSLRGSKYWQESWEYLCSMYEEQLNIRLFRWKAINTIEEDKIGDLELLKPRKISVSKLVMILSDFLSLIWLGFLIKDVLFLYKTKEILNQFKFTNYGLYFCLISLSILVYLLIFIFHTIISNQKSREQSDLFNDTFEK